MQERALDTLERELKTVVSAYVGAGNRTQILLKSNQHSAKPSEVLESKLSLMQVSDLSHFPLSTFK